MREIHLLEDEELDQIHATVVRILGETGIAVRHEGALQRVQEYGARVDRDQQRVWFSEDVISKALSKAPQTFTLAGADPSHDVHLGSNGWPYARPAVGGDYVVDPGATRHRRATLQDVEQWITLVRRLPSVHINGSPYPSDVPAEIRDLLVVERAFELSPKPVIISHYSVASLRWAMQLMTTLPERDAGCRLLPLISCNSPLTYTRQQVEVLLTAAENGVPIAINTAPLAGATAPYTLAGFVAQAAAELLTGVILAQSARPGAPMIWSPLPFVFDMRATAASGGYAEVSLMLAALVQLGQFYQLPTQSISLVTDAVIPDAQAGLEKVQASYLALLAHPDLVGGMGCLSGYEAASMEQLVLDSDILGGLFHAMEGLCIDDETLAWDVIDQVGPGGNYLGERHTLRHLRREYYFSQTANRLAPEAWAEAGAHDVRARASEQVRKLLAEPAGPVVPEDVIRELRRVLDYAQEDLTS